MELIKLTLLEAKRKIEKREITSLELTDAFIKNIEENDRLNAFITKTFDLAREQAKKSDERILKRGGGKLEGLPLAIKDIFCTEGIRTTAGSKMLGEFIPPYESSVTQKLKDEGFVMLGKTNMDEFACGSTTTTSYFGPTINPRRANGDERDLIPGGSSGGSSCATASNMCLAATATDTGGSIRQPAALCNLVGIKPTYGRVSRYGIVAYASSLDQAGWLTKNIEDAAFLTDIICGKDDKDSTTVLKEKTNFFGNLNPDIKGKKVGIIKEFLELGDKVHDEINQKFQDKLKLFRSNGCEIVEISIPTISYVPELYIIISYTELASNLARFDGLRYTHRTEKDVRTLDELYSHSRTKGFCDNIKKRILLGYFFSSLTNYEKFFLKAQKVRRKLANEFLEGLGLVDFILTPAAPQPAFPIQQTIEERQKNLESNYLNDLFVCPVNMAGLPGLVVPDGFTSAGLPVGIHLIGKHFDEQTLFDCGLFIEKNNK
ncbi:MAG: Asp-tRNA(Asn)/Glu-tRNA(Gln) amidotransferase subunit GatA [Rickettsiales bacterium]|jgi:aspartyl-tRNA(Asn)/glutamyl-tRNA(Gln) amidotransferase subunit A|nr:Asp-tRNA(Asn)/Glu-tRNA(Gln) amidotransferase subunit GatA [Rickettsiales bacterium]